MNINQITGPEHTPRQAAIVGLAIAGFVALVALGMWLAVYSARYVPVAVSQLGAAAVSLSQVFTPSNPGLSVVPSSTTTLPFGDGTSSTVSSASSGSSTVHPATTPGSETTATYPIGTGTAPSPTLSGNPDLTVTIAAAGYLSSTSTDTFVQSSTVPHGSRAAIKFTVSNIGTNVSGQWTFNAMIPTATSYLYQSIPQQSLNPGDHIDYVLGFDQANPGAAQQITVSVDPSNQVHESNENNNTATVSVTVLGS